MLMIKTIHGASMAPWAHNRDIVIAVYLPRGLLNPKQVILFKHPQYGHIIKRLDACNEQGQWRLRGDNAVQSVSSEQMGWVSLPYWVGRVIWVVKAPKFPRQNSNA